MNLRLPVVALSLLLVSMPSPAQAGDGIARTPAKPVDVSTISIPAAKGAPNGLAGARSAKPVVAELASRSTDDYSMVGVTWQPTAGLGDVAITVRTRSGSGWSAWQELEVDDQQVGRAGTEPVWVERANGIAVRASTTTGKRPVDLSVTTIDPGRDPVPASSAAAPAIYDPLASTSATIQAADGAPAYTAKPAIISRASWRASAGGTCDAPLVGETTKGFVLHHTAGTNSYDKSQSASIVRAVQAYHVNGRDWCDIGYNFLVDKYGQIFEGRKGGVDRTVRGAHAGNLDVNTYTMGVSMMGNFDTANVGTAMRNSIVKLIGWRAGTTFMPVTGTYAIGGKTLHRIAGHRNVVSTACPGRYGYAWLTQAGGLRDRVKAYVANYKSAIKTYAASLGATRTGSVYVGEWGSSTKRRAIFNRVDILWGSTTGVHYVGAFFRVEYNRLRSHAGPMGFPIVGQSSTSLARIAIQRFQYGTIYRVQTGTAYAAYGLWGSVGQKYVAEGETTGRLGAPIRHLYKDSTGAWVAQFENGTIRYTAATGSVVTVN